MNKIVFVALLIMACSKVFSQVSLFVSTDGKSMEFSSQKPGNIENLNSKIQSIRKLQSGTIRVMFRGGVYLLSKPFEITSNDAGRDKDSLILTAVAGEKVLFSGGRKVVNWAPFMNGIYMARLSAGTEFRQIYVNGKMAIRARTPNREDENDFGPYYRVGRFDVKNQQVLIKLAEMPSLKNVKDAEMVINTHWYQHRMQMVSSVVKGDTAAITFKDPLKEVLFKMYPNHIKPGVIYYFENALSFLDQEGEWYFDREESMLYYKPKAGEDIKKLEIVYPALDKVIAVNGTSPTPVCNLVIRDIEVAYGNWVLPNRFGIVATQGVQGRTYYATDEAALIEVAFSRNVSIENCSIYGAGKSGILFRKGVKNSRISYCHLDQISGNAVVILNSYNKAFPPDSLSNTNDIISDNLIENYGLHYTNGMGLLASYAEKLVVEHNEIRYGKYMGMQIGNHHGDQLNGMRDNLIRYNHIHHIMKLHDDGGGIYTLSLQPGTRIMNNWLHDITRGKWAQDYPVAGIYQDNNSGYIWVQDNVLTDITDRFYEQCAGGAETRGNVYINNNRQDKDIKTLAGPRK